MVTAVPCTSCMCSSSGPVIPVLGLPIGDWLRKRHRKSMLCRGTVCSSESQRCELWDNKVRLESMGGGRYTPSPHFELSQNVWWVGGIIRPGLTITSWNASQKVDVVIHIRDVRITAGVVVVEIDWRIFRRWNGQGRRGGGSGGEKWLAVLIC